MLYCVDRITEGKAVLFDEKDAELVLDAARLGGAKEGDWGRLDTVGNFVPDATVTAERRAVLNDLLNEILNR